MSRQYTLCGAPKPGVMFAKNLPKHRRKPAGQPTCGCCNAPVLLIGLATQLEVMFPCGCPEKKRCYRTTRCEAHCRCGLPHGRPETAAGGSR
jgi:hypothetical protein